MLEHCGQVGQLFFLKHCVQKVNAPGPRPRRQVFTLAAKLQPAIIFIDEIGAPRPASRMGVFSTGWENLSVLPVGSHCVASSRAKLWHGPQTQRERKAKARTGG